MFKVDSKFDKKVEATKCRKLVVGRWCCDVGDGRFFMSKGLLIKHWDLC